MSRAVRRGLQLAGLARVAGGVALVSRPEVVAARVAGPAGRAVPVRVCRLLGVRMLGQGLTEICRPRRSTAMASAAVDLSHALTVPLAVAIWPSCRRSAGLSATAAAVLAAADAVLGRRLPDRGHR